MTQEATREEIVVQDGVIVGGLRRPVNNAANEKGSIHDDATATRLGLRGGTVAGSIHLDLFPPLLLNAFGPRWFERGSISMYFLNATTDREPVRAHLHQPAAGVTAGQVDAWVVREDGMRVADGTAAVGDSTEQTALQRRPLDRFDTGELRILRDLKVGDAMPEAGVIYSPDAHARRMAVNTDPIDFYTEASPYGAPIVSPAGMVQMLYAQNVAGYRESFGGAVGLFGAIELRNVNGPMLVDRPYTVTGKVLAVGESPKTEYFWFETGADDADGTRVAEMRMLLRFMKASSSRYAASE